MVPKSVVLAGEGAGGAGDQVEGAQAVAVGVRPAKAPLNSPT